MYNTQTNRQGDPELTLDCKHWQENHIYNIQQYSTTILCTKFIIIPELEIAIVAQADVAMLNSGTLRADAIIEKGEGAVQAM